MRSLFRRKSIQPIPSYLRRCLTAWDLTLLGIGAIIGAGVFVLTGIAAATKAGPAVMISYVIAGLASLFSALCYAEMAASVGGCGSAYSYAYSSFGELIAWIIGWDLIFEYSMSVSAVAIGWSGYIKNLLVALNIHFPTQFIEPPLQGGILDLPAILIIFLLATLLAIGVKESSRFNAVIVFIKLTAIAIFIVIASQHVDMQNWVPYAPFGYTGVIEGAALVFFAYIGFDAVSTAVEESVNPQRDAPIGIVGSVAICTIIYLVVAGLLTAIVPYQRLNDPSPVANALLILGYKTGAGIVAAGAIAGLTTVMLVMYYGLTRVFLAMARDGLLPIFFFKIHPRTKTPVLIIFLSGIIIACIAGLMPLSEAAQLVNIGTLFAFSLVCGGVLFMRWTQPDLARPFKLPFFPLVPIFGILFCIYLMLHLSWLTWLRFLLWLLLGLLIYIAYGKKHAQIS